MHLIGTSKVSRTGRRRSYPRSKPHSGTVHKELGNSGIHLISRARPSPFGKLGGPQTSLARSRFFKVRKRRDNKEPTRGIDNAPNIAKEETEETAEVSPEGSVDFGSPRLEGEWAPSSATARPEEPPKGGVPLHRPTRNYTSSLLLAHATPTPTILPCDQ